MEMTTYPNKCDMDNPNQSCSCGSRARDLYSEVFIRRGHRFMILGLEWPIVQDLAHETRWRDAAVRSAGLEANDDGHFLQSC